MNITYAIDKNVYKLALVSFASLLKNNMQEDIDLYILCKKNENYLEESFLALKKIKNFNLYIKEVGITDLKDLPVAWLTTEIWFRAKLSELLPTCDRVIYLDCDTLVLKNISDLYTRNMDDFDIIARREKTLETKLLPILKLKNHWYFNSGVMICNLENWRKHDLSDKLLNIAKLEKSNLIYPDQYVFNIVCDLSKAPFEKGDVYLTYNDDGAQNHSIVHFTGPKPTEVDCVSKKYQKEWWKYAKYTPVYKPLIVDYKNKKWNFIKDNIFSVKTNSKKIIIKILFIKITFKRNKND